MIQPVVLGELQTNKPENTFCKKLEKNTQELCTKLKKETPPQSLPPYTTTTTPITPPPRARDGVQWKPHSLRQQLPRPRQEGYTKTKFLFYVFCSCRNPNPLVYFFIFDLGRRCGVAFSVFENPRTMERPQRISSTPHPRISK